jgi:hypothetical protein
VQVFSFSHNSLWLFITCNEKVSLLNWQTVFSNHYEITFYVLIKVNASLLCVLVNSVFNNFILCVMNSLEVVCLELTVPSLRCHSKAISPMVFSDTSSYV